jgi:hypothetical protein
VFANYIYLHPSLMFVAKAWNLPSESCNRPHFCIDVTFEIRTVFSGIHLFNDKSEMIARVFISKQKEGKESKIVERLRESECERQSFAERGR